MAAIACKVYRFDPGAVIQAGFPAGLAGLLAGDVITSATFVSMDMEVVRGEVVYTVLHT
mgnify:CR=1 FL=1